MTPAMRCPSCDHDNRAEHRPDRSHLPDGPHQAGSAEALVVGEQRDLQAQGGAGDQPIERIDEAAEPARYGAAKTST